MSDLSLSDSHRQANSSLLAWLQAQNVPVITEVDTRSLTKHLRSRGTMLGAITKPDAKLNFRKAELDSAPHFLTEPKLYTAKKPGAKQVVLVDCGAKGSILNELLAAGLSVKRVPYDYDYTSEDFDGVVLSNGPGDPTDYQPAIAVTRKALALDKPIFGICLGNQVLGLAAGGKTYKLPYGHRGHNQPCIETENERCAMTSQNHGYALDEKSLPKDWRVSYRNLNDNSVEGIAHRTKPYFSVQFHPEANPGPTDTRNLFERFFTSL